MQWKWKACYTVLVNSLRWVIVNITYVTDAPSYSALLTGGGCLVCLTFDTQIHDVISADSAVVDDDIPGPESHGIPLGIRY